MGSHRPRIVLRLLQASLLACSLVLEVPAGDAMPSGSATKVEPRLLRISREAPEDTVTAWIEFADKGERDPGDLARRLALAEQSLSPRSLARRRRAHVHPLVDYLDLPIEPAYLEALRARGLAPYGASRWLNRVAVRAPARRVPELAGLSFVTGLTSVEAMRRSGDPQGASPPISRPARREGAGSVGYGLTHDAIYQLDVAAVHDSGYTGNGTLICVLDDGFNYFDTHEALSDRVIPSDHQRDFYRGVASVQDLSDPAMVHGTWVLGVMAGRKFGTYVGAAYGADYALGRTEVFDFERPVEMVYWASGAEWADSLGADVINTSLGYTTFDDPDSSYARADMDGHTTLITRAAQIAASKGILVVAAIGNDGQTAWHFLGAPSDANGDSVLAVGAVDVSGVPAPFSSYGPSFDGRIKPDLAADGVQVWTPGTSGDPTLYSKRDGTSFSTPLISGLAACLLQARPQWSPRDVILALRASASRKGAPDDRVGYGIPDGMKALTDTTLAPPPPSPRLALRSTGPNPIFFDRGPGRFTLAIPSSLCGAPASVRVRDAMGRQVREVWSGMVSCPALPLTWNGLDDEGRAVPAGLYLVDVRVGGERVTLRLVGLR